MKIYKTAIYLRLSRDDLKNSTESNSISNQRELLTIFAKSQEDLSVVAEYIDDGYSGYNYEKRPQFQEMLQAAKDKEIDCIIVKDLSRLGRNFVETEELMQLTFPRLGVRFIAVSNCIDSIKEKTFNERISAPFLNLINEVYVSETSQKIRKVFDMKRRNGEFIGNYTVYGYVKSDKQMVIDDESAEVVRKIFKMKIDGMSYQGIADFLNSHEVLSPLDYKKSKNIPVSGFEKSGEKANWQANTVRRILENPVYTGTLIQGKTSTPSYKDKRRFVKEKSEWSVFENSHDPIISETIFQVVQDLLLKDSYSNSQGKSYLFSGFVFCGNCGQQLYHRQCDYKGKKKSTSHTYYVCRNKECCDKKNIAEKDLATAVLETLQTHLRLVIDYSQPKNLTEIIEDTNNNNEFISAYTEQIQNIEETRRTLVKRLEENVISDKEFDEMDAYYKQKIIKITAEKEEILNRKKRVAVRISDVIERFKEYSEMSELTRGILVTFIEKIIVESKKSINISFRYENFFTSENGGENNGS
jgi:DNA invertase Pin-like site-specific DNA recombinase